MMERGGLCSGPTFPEGSCEGEHNLTGKALLRGCWETVDVGQVEVEAVDPQPSASAQEGANPSPLLRNPVCGERPEATEEVMPTPAGWRRG